MKEFISSLLGKYFKPTLTIMLVLFIFAFIFWVMWADLTEASKRFGDVILGVLLSILGMAINYWLGTADRKNKENEEK